ncbi:MAG: phage tail tube protein [Firmicutes bacterium]|nr:phage tail tube protein [Bacillota bacterium]
MAVKPTAPRVMNGKWGMVYLDGEPVYETDSYEAKITIEREDVDFIGQMAKDSKMTGLTGEWSLKVKKVFSRGAQLLSEKIKKGQDVRIQIISKIDDPDAYGSERLVIENAWFNGLTLQKFENSKIIDEEFSGGFTDYYFPDLVKVR